MRLRRFAALSIAGTAILFSAQCQQGLFREYEYEEQVHLELDGSATVIVNTSIAALVALRGLTLDATPTAAVDRDAIRAFYQSPVTTVTRVSRPWRRAGRRFVQVRVETEDIRALDRSAPFAWSSYRLVQRGEVVTYTQILREAAGTAPAAAGWRGSEQVAVRLHLPSRIQFHNATTRTVERGNILSWEQPLRERLEGKPLAIEVRMEAESILVRTLTLFGLSAAAAVTLFAAVILWVRRKGRLAARR